MEAGALTKITLIALLCVAVLPRLIDTLRSFFKVVLSGSEVQLLPLVGCIGSLQTAIQIERDGGFEALLWSGGCIRWESGTAF